MISNSMEYIRRRAAEADGVEIYRYGDATNRLHGDFLRPIDMTIDGLPVVDGAVLCDVFVMEEDEYNTSILANCDLTFTDIYNKSDKICVIVLPHTEDI